MTVGWGGFRVGTAFRVLKPSHFDAVSDNKFIQAERGKPDRETAGGRGGERERERERDTHPTATI